MLTSKAMHAYLEDPTNGLTTPKSRETCFEMLRRLDGRRDLDSWTEDDLVDFVTRPCKVGARAGQPPADATIRSRRAKLMSFFSWCHWKQLIPADPSAHLKKAVRAGNQPVRTHNWLTEADVATVLAAVDHDSIQGRRDDVLLRLGFTAGLRCAELIGLTWGDLDLEAGTLTIVGKGRKLATLALSENTRLALIDWKSEGTAALGRPPAAHEAVLIKVTNHSDLAKGLEHRIIEGRWTEPGISPSSVRSRCRHYAELTGIPFSPHDMRRTFAGLLEKKVSVHDVSKALRHSNVAVTEKYLEARHDSAARVQRSAGLDF